MAGLELFLLAGVVGGLIKGIHDNKGFLKLPYVDPKEGLYLGFVFDVIIGLLAGYAMFTVPNAAPWTALTTALSGPVIIETLADRTVTKPKP